MRRADGLRRRGRVDRDLGLDLLGVARRLRREGADDQLLRMRSHSVRDSLGYEGFEGHTRSLHRSISASTLPCIHPRWLFFRASPWAVWAHWAHLPLVPLPPLACVRFAAFSLKGLGK